MYRYNSYSELIILISFLCTFTRIKSSYILEKRQFKVQPRLANIDHHAKPLDHRLALGFDDVVAGEYAHKDHQRHQCRSKQRNRFARIDLNVLRLERIFKPVLASHVSYP